MPYYHTGSGMISHRHPFYGADDISEAEKALLAAKEAEVVPPAPVGSSFGFGMVMLLGAAFLVYQIAKR
jgi:hypothetical protein